MKPDQVFWAIFHRAGKVAAVARIEAPDKRWALIKAHEWKDEKYPNMRYDRIRIEEDCE